MKKFRTFGIAAVITAAAAVPLAGGGFAGAQDSGDCGEGGVAVAEEQQNVGGLLGAVAPILTQTVAPVNAPVSSPNAQNCNENEVEIGGGGGGHKAGGGGGGGHAGGGAGGAAPAQAVGGAPRFAG